MKNEKAMVTIVAVAREKFSYVPQFIEGLYRQSGAEFKLVYVDGGSPKKLKKFLEEESIVHGFTLIRTEHFLSPTTARNIGLTCVETPYVVFIDNDVAVEPNWLAALLKCARETEADAVGPLIAETWAAEDLIHYGGGEFGIDIKEIDGRQEKQLYKKVHHNGCPVAATRAELKREPTNYVEFHCVLFRTAIFKKIGFMDDLLSSEDHSDLSLRLNLAGAKIIFEPTCCVTFVSNQLTLSDIPFYMMRWCDSWQVRSLKHLIAKWDAAESDFFWIRIKRTDSFRHKNVIDPWSKKLLGGRLSGLIARFLTAIDGFFDRVFYERYFETKASTKKGWDYEKLLIKESDPREAAVEV